MTRATNGQLYEMLQITLQCMADTAVCEEGQRGPRSMPCEGCVCTGGLAAYALADDESPEMAAFWSIAKIFYQLGAGARD